MPSTSAAPLFRYIRGLTRTRPADELSDRQLVQRFAEQRDGEAFASLVRRHGATVLGVCRRVLGHEQDAEDVFQAVFLVLSRKAGALRRKEAVGPWLFGVAYRLALRARREARQRREREGRAGGRPGEDPLAELTVREAQAVLYEEVARLPERDRGPLVLCYLEGLTRDEAARRLGCPLGTLKCRLERARAALQKRLARRGLTLAAVVSTLLLAGKSAGATPIRLQVATAKAVMAFAAGSSAGGVVGPEAAALADGVLRSAFVSRLQIAVVLLGVIAGGIGVGAATREVQAVDTSVARPDAVLARLGPPERRPPAPAAREPVPDRGEPRGRAPIPQGNHVPQGITSWRRHAALAAHQKAARALAFSPDGSRVASGGDDGWVRVWDVTAAKESLAMRGPNARPVRVVSFSRGGDLLAAGTDDGAVLVWDLRGGGSQAPEVIFQRAGREVHALWVGADRSAVARAWCDGSVEWRGGPAGAPPPLPGQAGEVHGVALCREGRTAAWAIEDGSVKLWDLAAREERGHFRVHTSRVWCVAFSPEGDTAASADHYATLKVWDTTTGRERATARGHEGHVRALALASGGRRLASGGDDRTVRVWDAKTGEELAALAGH
jgi:RNA polymerase sigma factor (sigma-70 family)